MKFSVSNIQGSLIVKHNCVCSIVTWLISCLNGSKSLPNHTDTFCYHTGQVLEASFFSQSSLHTHSSCSCLAIYKWLFDNRNGNKYKKSRGCSETFGRWWSLSSAEQVLRCWRANHQWCSRCVVSDHAGHVCCLPPGSGFPTSETWYWACTVPVPTSWAIWKLLRSTEKCSLARNHSM